MNEIGWTDKTICFHVINYLDFNDDMNNILEKVENILNWQLKSAVEQWKTNIRNQIFPDKIHVFSPLYKWSRGDNPKEYLVNIINSFHNILNLIISAEHEEDWSLPYPQCIVKKWEIPKVIALIINNPSFYLFDEYFRERILSLSRKYDIPILDQKLNPFEYENFS